MTTPSAHGGAEDIQTARKNQAFEAVVSNGTLNSDGDIATQNTASVSKVTAQHPPQPRVSLTSSVHDDGSELRLRALDGSAGYWTTRALGPC